ncbi:FAD binding domain protein [Aspergillus flavus]|nr:FAD binding domain protein [Aspergillus flavus]RAQ59288.1 FAD binding domain protein [Aspergillus flavus]
MADEQLPVLIIGAGISGLVLAQYLKTKGVPFQIFERDSAIDARSGGWGLTLHWALPALRQLLPEDIVAQLPETYVNKEAAARGDTGRYQFFDLKSGEALYNVPAAERIRVSRVRMRQLLTSGIEVQWNKSLKDIESSPDSVTAHFEDNSTCKGRLLLSCDGSRSLSRQILYPTDHEMQPLPVQLLGATALYTPKEMNGAQKIDPFIFQGAHPDTNVYLFFSFLDTPNNFSDSTDKYHCQLIVSWADSKGIDVPKSNAERLALMKSLTTNWADPFRSLIHQIPDETEVVSIRVADWIFSPRRQRGHPRVVLVGDSAHTMTMFRGEGANNAIVDVQDLVKRIDFTLAGSFTLDALRSSVAAYEQDIFARAETSVLNSRQACLDAHDFEKILNGSPLVSKRVLQEDK